MTSKSIQIFGETITEKDIKSTCTDLEANNVKILSLRDCELSDKNYKRLMKSVGKCRSILQLAMNIGIVTSEFRVQLLAQALSRNHSLNGLYIHGNAIGDDGMKVLTKTILHGGRLNSLDVGDCQLSDESVPYLCQLLSPSLDWPGLLDLSVSGNTEITHSGWVEFSLALAASSLRSLYLDYNQIGDQTAACIVVGVAGCGNTLEVIDLEGTGVTQKTAKLMLNLVENYPVRLRKVSFSGNKVKKATIEAIKFCLSSSVEETDETEASDADIMSLSTRSSLAQPRHAEVNVVTSSGEVESGNDTDRTLQDYSLHSEVVDQSTAKPSTSQLPCDSSEEQLNPEPSTVENEEEEEEFVDDIKEVPVYYTGIPVTF